MKIKNYNNALALFKMYRVEVTRSDLHCVCVCVCVCVATHERGDFVSRSQLILSRFGRIPVVITNLHLTSPNRKHLRSNF